MKIFKKLIAELWEHPFSGKDYTPVENYDQEQELHEKIFPHYQHTFEEATRVQNLPSASLSPKDRAIKSAHDHLWAYTADSSPLNKRLIEHAKDPTARQWMYPNELKRHDEFVGRMNSLLHNHKTPFDFHAYSGLGFNPEHIMEHGETHGKLHLPAFTSTSLSPRIAHSFAEWKGRDNMLEHHHIVKIHIPQGSRGLYRRGEQEFILPNNSKLHMHPTPEDHVYNKLHPVKVWHAKLVHDGVEDTRHMSEFK
jgi:hypothetical protein